MTSSLSGGSSAPSGDASAAASSGGEGDPNAGNAVVIRPPSFWEKHFSQESPFFERLRGFVGGAGNAAGDVGDRMGGWIGETEEAEAMAEVSTHAFASPACAQCPEAATAKSSELSHTATLATTQAEPSADSSADGACASHGARAVPCMTRRA